MEVEILPQAVAENIAITPYRSLAQGLLPAICAVPATEASVRPRGALSKRMVPSLQNNVRRHPVERTANARWRLAIAGRLLPHEWLGGAFLVLLWARLVLVEGVFGHSTSWLALLIVSNALVLVSGALRESEVRWRLRLLFYPVAMNLVYFLLGSRNNFV